jgi:response regulator RpfG family c-di-GMP phosphodiesterase
MMESRMSISEPKAGSQLLHRLLIVDDEEIVLVALRDTLRHEGYDVAACGNPLEALNHLRSESFSVIITDQQMPLITGLDFLAQAKVIQPDCTRILITAVLNLSTVIDAINKGEIYRFIIKPWLREELLATVASAVQRYELICKNRVLQATTLSMNERLSEVNRTLEQQVARVADQNLELERLNGALKQNLDRSVELCLKMMETFYPTLGTQARRVHVLCRAMANALGLPPDQKESIEVAAWLHDIGLVGVPRGLIRRWDNEPGGLTEHERALVEHHPILGQELAAFAHTLSAVGEAIRAHHERYDGKGYPDQLAGQNIPWLGRLLAVAVAFVESDHDVDTTTEMLRHRAGTAYDPEAVQALITSLPRVTVPRKQREVSLTELEPGMVLAKGIYTANGILLIPDGQRLSATYIDKLHNHHRINPITQSMLVYC